MTLVSTALLFALRANGLTGRLLAAREQRFDPFPVIKLFSPVGAATWLATEIDEDGDMLFGLADLGSGCPELGFFSLAEIARVRLPFGLAIERDTAFEPRRCLSVWTEAAHRLGSIIAAEQAFRRTDQDMELPPAGG